MTIELAACLLAAAAAFFYIFYPATFFVGPKKTRASYLRERKDAPKPSQAPAAGAAAN